jgi:hypothetical protein
VISYFDLCLFYETLQYICCSTYQPYLIEVFINSMIKPKACRNLKLDLALLVIVVLIDIVLLIQNLLSVHCTIKDEHRKCAVGVAYVSSYFFIQPNYCF